MTDAIKPRRPQKKIGVRETPGVIVGRDQVVIPPDEVIKLASIGCKDHEIADWFGIDNNTLRYNFSVELLKGRESLKQSLRRAQIKLALSGNAVMLIWLGKNLLGQSDNPLNSDDRQPLPWTDD
jgi:hypothetical protein